MRKLIVAIAAAASFGAQADTKLCGLIGVYAEAVMQSRQEGVPLAKNLQIADESFEDTTIPHKIVEQAYIEPRYHTASSKIRAAEEYRTRWELLCRLAMKD